MCEFQEFVKSFVQHSRVNRKLIFQRIVVAEH